MGFFKRIKGLARLAATQPDEQTKEVGDFIEPGSGPEISAMPSGAAAGGSSLGQLKELQAAGLIDASTFEMIETSMTNASKQIEELHASGVMSDEIYAQATASLSAANAGSGSAAAAELELLQHGESAAATVLAAPEPSDGAGTPAEAAGGRLRVKLEVHPATGSPFPVECTVPAFHPGGEVEAGDFLRVRFDPADPTKAAIDWAGFGAGDG